MVAMTDGRNRGLGGIVLDVSQSSVSVRCDDCGATHELADGHDGTELLSELHLFLKEHATCSYSVSVNLTNADEAVGRPEAAG
jgi:hypothetical protein